MEHIVKCGCRELYAVEKAKDACRLAKSKLTYRYVSTARERRRENKPTNTNGEGYKIRAILQLCKLFCCYISYTD